MLQGNAGGWVLACPGVLQQCVGLAPGGIRVEAMGISEAEARRN